MYRFAAVLVVFIGTNDDVHPWKRSSSGARTWERVCWSRIFVHLLIVYDFHFCRRRLCEGVGIPWKEIHEIEWRGGYPWILVWLSEAISTIVSVRSSIGSNWAGRSLGMIKVYYVTKFLFFLCWVYVSHQRIALSLGQMEDYEHEWMNIYHYYTTLYIYNFSRSTEEIVKWRSDVK